VESASVGQIDLADTQIGASYSSLQSHRLRVLLVVSGFPTARTPDVGIFNLRAAQNLQQFVDVQVVHLRMWLPTRRLITHSEHAGVRVTTIAVPLLPLLIGRTRAGTVLGLTNALLYRQLGWPQVRLLLCDCDIVHSVGAGFAGLIASSWAKRARVHHVTQITDAEIEGVLQAAGRIPFLRRWREHLQGVACNSQALAKDFLALHPEVKNVRPVWRGVDLNRFQESGPAEGPFVDRPPVRYLFLGGFPSYRQLPFGTNTKGGETLLSAWRAAENELIPRGASLVIAGPKSRSNRLEQWRSSLRCPERVALVGPLRPAQVPEYIRACEVVLIPSLQEGLPNVAFEASACGRAVFASRIGGLNEVVVPNDTGVLLPPGDVMAWKDALASFACQAARLREMGQRARRRTEALFDARTVTLQMVELYHAALGEPLPQA
jgi:glycosyltransferase involved in cell wall biosynthesis